MVFATCMYKDNELLVYVDREKKTAYSLNDIFESDKQLTMNDFIRMYSPRIEENILKALKNNDLEELKLEEIKLLAPIPYPKRNVFCLGKNYSEHVKEVKGYTGGNGDNPEYPIYFSKVCTPCIGNEDIILNHKNVTQMLDYEVELAVIIGKRGINIPKEDVEEYIFGYTIGNDISARDLQKRHLNWLKGKSLTTHCPMGPWIVEKKHIPFPVKIDLKCSINGQVRQDSNTRHLLFDIPSIVSDLSQGLELFPGDIILTGTPSGVGLGFNPPKYLKPGDVVECFIENIGILSNTMEK